MTHLMKWKTNGKVQALFWAVLLFASSVGVSPLWAHKGEKPDGHEKAKERTGTGGIRTAEDKILDSVGFDQKLDNQLPLGLEFKDESGKTVQLRQYFGEKPVIILPIYYRCGTLCPIGAEEMLRSLKQIKPAIGQEYQIVTLSIDPKEGPELAEETKKRYVKEYKRDDVKTAAGWHFLTGKHKAIDELCEAIGFRYAYVEKTGEYAHPDGLVVVTPEGKVARYFYRLDYPPRDIQFGLMEAAHERIGSPLQYLALSCFHYDPTLGKYNLSVMKVLRVFSAFFVVLCLAVIAFVVRLERKNERKLEQAEANVGAQTVAP